MNASYQIAELKDDQFGGFAPRGAVKQLWKSRDFETFISGPAETGKTWGTLQYADALLWKYAGAQGVMVRKTYADLVASALRTYLRIIGPGSPVKAYGGERPQWFDYPNGSRLWLAGLDNPGKVLSTERDFFYINQAEEITLNDFETITTRATGRGAVMPYTRVFGECNPGPPTHWIKQRASSGQLTLLESRHLDNPTLYDDAGDLLPAGERTMRILDALTGVRRKRLRDGIWAAAEGIVYDDFDPAIHVIEEMPAGWQNWRKIRAIDFGLRNPFVCQWWAIDGDGRMYRYREIYMTERLVEQHARQIVQLSEGETYQATLADHDVEGRTTLSRAGIRTVPAWKVKGSVEVGIQAVSSRLVVDRDKLPRIFLLRRARVERDEALASARHPTSTEEEFSEYAYEPGIDGKPNKEEPVKLYDHGLDAMRYAVAYVDNLAGSRISVSGASPVGV